MVTRRAVVLSGAVVLSALACGRRHGPRDIGNLHPKSEFPPGAEPRDGGPLPDGSARILAAPTVGGAQPRKLARATSRAIAIDRERIYFGDASDDGLYALPRAGGTPQKLARRAAMPEALSVDAATGALAWIGTPGDVVLRMPTAGGAAQALREHGLFTGVVASGADVFYVEAEGTGGFLSRNTTRLGSFEGSPRSLTRSGDRFFVATSSHVVALRGEARAEVTSLAGGAAFSHVAAEGDWVYATTPDPGGRGRIVVRVPATGGPLEAVATSVRDAPIAVFHGTVYWFDADRPAILSAEPGHSPRTVSEDDLFAQPAAIAVDAEGVFLAAGVGEDGQILVIPFARGRGGDAGT